MTDEQRAAGDLLVRRMKTKGVLVALGASED
jgi:hypothetical protein